MNSSPSAQAHGRPTSVMLFIIKHMIHLCFHGDWTVAASDLRASASFETFDYLFLVNYCRCVSADLHSTSALEKDQDSEESLNKAFCCTPRS